MRTLLLFRGAPGCGKSTFIKEHGLEPYTLCADTFRMLYSSPTLYVNGEVHIPQNVNAARFGLIRELARLNSWRLWCGLGNLRHS